MMQNDFGLISIIMAAYNAEKTIEQAINSVLSQTYTNFELLVVNDCSTDRTAELVKSIAAKDSRVRLISNVKNSGVSYTRKHGLEEAKGSWISILDSDDAWAPEKLEKQIDLQRRTNADLLFTGSAFMDSEGHPIDWYLRAPSEVTYRQLLKQNVLSNSSALVRKELYAKNYAVGDEMHEDFAIWLSILKKGMKAYDMLLEKPFAISEEEVNYLYKVVKETGRKVMICHVLRYAPFYVAIKQRLLSGEIGDIINIQATEHVSYHHLAVSFVRGKWGNEEKCGAPMLLAKCCHDMDLIMWLKSGVSPKQIASFGSDFQFDPAKKPAGAGKRCLVDCQCEETCLYSAKKHYLDHPDRWAFYVWDCLENIENPTLEDKRKSLMTDNIHGRCVWDCEHTVVDHQSVLMNFADGATATLNMIGGTAKPERNIHIIGTKGEIKGVFDDSVFTVRTIDTASEKGWNEEVVDLKIGGDKSGMTGSHGGGDLRLVEDFVHVLQGEEPSISCTTIKDSINGHLGVFCAERARKESAVITMPDIR